MPRKPTFAWPVRSCQVLAGNSTVISAPIGVLFAKKVEASSS